MRDVSYVWVQKVMMAWAHTSNIQTIRVGGSCGATCPSSRHHPRLDNVPMLIHNACNLTCLTYSSAWNLLLLALASYNSYKYLLDYWSWRGFEGRLSSPIQAFWPLWIGQVQKPNFARHIYNSLCVCYAHGIMCVNHMVLNCSWLFALCKKWVNTYTHDIFAIIDAIFSWL